MQKVRLLEAEVENQMNQASLGGEKSHSTRSVSGSGIASDSRSAFTAQQKDRVNGILGVLLSQSGLKECTLCLILGLEKILLRLLTYEPCLSCLPAKITSGNKPV